MFPAMNQSGNHILGLVSTHMRVPTRFLAHYDILFVGQCFQQEVQADPPPAFISMFKHFPTHLLDRYDMLVVGLLLLRGAQAET